jgi:hypothetical protein
MLIRTSRLYKKPKRNMRNYNKPLHDGIRKAQCLDTVLVCEVKGIVESAFHVNDEVVNELAKGRWRSQMG